MFHYEWLFLMQIVTTILMIVFLQKLSQMKKRVDTITQEVMQYISYITEDLEIEKEEESMPFVTKMQVQKKQEEAQNRLIQAVLGEFFP